MLSQNRAISPSTLETGPRSGHCGTSHSPLTADTRADPQHQWPLVRPVSPHLWDCRQTTQQATTTSIATYSSTTTTCHIRCRLADRRPTFTTTRLCRRSHRRQWVHGCRQSDSNMSCSKSHRCQCRGMDHRSNCSYRRCRIMREGSSITNSGWGSSGRHSIVYITTIAAAITTSTATSIAVIVVVTTTTTLGMHHFFTTNLDTGPRTRFRSTIDQKQQRWTIVYRLLVAAYHPWHLRASLGQAPARSTRITTAVNPAISSHHHVHQPRTSITNTTTAPPLTPSLHPLPASAVPAASGSTGNAAKTRAVTRVASAKSSATQPNRRAAPSA